MEIPGARENASNPDCTENTKEYSANQKKLIKEFTEYKIIPRRKKVFVLIYSNLEYTIFFILFTPLFVPTTYPNYKQLAEPVSNPIHYGDTTVPKAIPFLKLRECTRI
jgi:hypothetical protein